jgi:ABC-type bacteriocin/lantibiotic exporter with double-glycine peptidase domain
MIKLKPFKQAKEGFCGPVVLRMAMNYFGVQASEEELAKVASTSEKWGTPVSGMVEAAKHFGFDVFYKEEASIKDLGDYVLDKKMPVIVRWFSEDEGHYSVVIDISDKNIVMADPLFAKKRIISVEKFSRVWFDLARSEEQVLMPTRLIKNFMMVLIPRNSN